MADTPAPIRSTGIGSWPGLDFAEALRINFAECPELPYLPELPARGPEAGLVGRGVAVLEGLSVDLQPAGWRLTDAPGRDHLRARTMLRDDRDRLEEAVQDYVGPFKVAIAGPWTLAATVERPRGDRVLADHGARRDLGQSLAEGIGSFIADLRRRLPHLELIVQLDEPALPAVLAGDLSTASGFSRHRKIDIAEVSDGLSGVLAAIRSALGDSGPPAVPRTWLHSCAAGVPVMLIKNAGFDGLAVDLDQLTTADWDLLGHAMSDGLWLGAGAVTTSTGPATDRQWSPDSVGQRVLRAVRTLGLEPEVGGRMVLSPSCGLARFDQASAVRALRAARTAAGIVTDQLAD